MKNCYSFFKEVIIPTFLIMVVFFAGIMIGISFSIQSLQKEAVEAGVGQYNATTGLFEYKKL